MRRGQVILVNLEPAKPGEASKTRPCVVVSNNGSNAAVERYARGTLTVVPITSNTDAVRHGFQVPIDEQDVLRSMGLSRPSKVQAEQVRAVSVDRISEGIGWTTPEMMREIDLALRFHLSL